MPRSLTAVLSCAFAAMSVLAASQFIQTAKSPSVLEATGEVISESFGAGFEHKSFSVQAKIRLHVRNLTTEKLIIPKDLRSYGFNLARDAKSLAAGAMEAQFHGGDTTIEFVKVVSPPVNPLSSPLDAASTPQPTAVEVTLNADDLETAGENGTRTPNSAFVILNPGESFEDVVEFGDLEVQCDDKGQIRSGSHVLQLDISPWSYPGIDAKEMAARWQKFGRLVYESFRTGPILFNIPRDPEVHPCAGSQAGNGAAPPRKPADVPSEITFGPAPDSTLAFFTRLDENGKPLFVVKKDGRDSSVAFFPSSWVGSDGGKVSALASNLITAEFEKQYLEGILKNAEISSRDPRFDKSGKKIGEFIVASRFYADPADVSHPVAAVVFTNGTEVYQITSDSLEDAKAFAGWWVRLGK